jgi:hypothetical protein
MQGATHCRSILANARMTCALIHWARFGPGPGRRWYPSHSPWQAGAEFVTGSASSRIRRAYSSHNYRRYCTVPCGVALYSTVPCGVALYSTRPVVVGHKTRMWRIQKNEKNRGSYYRSILFWSMNEVSKSRGLQKGSPSVWKYSKWSSVLVKADCLLTAGDWDTFYSLRYKACSDTWDNKEDQTCSK